MTLRNLPGVALFFLWCADTPLGGDGDQGVAQLGEGHPQEIQLVIRQTAGKVICRSGDGSGQFAGIHRITLPDILCQNQPAVTGGLLLNGVFSQNVPHMISREAAFAVKCFRVVGVSALAGNGDKIRLLL